MAPDLTACERITAAENAPYWPEVVKAQEMIAAGAIGEIITARAAHGPGYLSLRRLPPVGKSVVSSGFQSQQTAM